MDGFAFHPYPETREHAAGRPASEPALDARSALADIDAARRACCGEAFGARAADPLQRARRRERASRPRRRRSTRARSRRASRSTSRRRPTSTAARSSSPPARRASSGLLVFHSHDEPALRGCQSGVYYVDGSPKASLPRGARGGRGGAGAGAYDRTREQRGRRRPVRRLHLLQGRPGVAAPAGRGARRGQGRLRRGRRDRGRSGSRCGRTRPRASGPDCDFFLWKITERYAGSRRARRGAERDAARRLARDAVLLPRDHEGLAVQPGAPRAEDRPARPSLSRRLPVREDAPLVRAAARGPPARDGRAHRRPAPASRRSRTTRPTRSASTTRSS